MTLDSKIEDIFRLNQFQKNALKKLGIQSVEDILYHFPTRYGEQSQTKNIANLKEGDKAEIFGEIRKLKASKAWRKKITMAEGTLHDHSGKIKIVWFNQPYIAKMYSNDSFVKTSTIVSVLSLRPFHRLSCTKSMAQRSLGLLTSGNSNRVCEAFLRRGRLRNDNFSSR